MESEKKYGLVFLKKPLKNNKVTKNVFDNDSSDEDGPRSTTKKNPYSANNLKIKTQLDIQKAIEDDPTVYEYDNVYDEIQEKKVPAHLKQNKADNKPRYIGNLLKMAEKRKKEDERRVERQVQKEREAEGDLYKDKESFVTSSFRKKMEEIQKAEEEERKQEAIEDMLDVRKQNDMSGFYRYILNQQTDKIEKEPDKEKNESDKEKNETSVKENKISDMKQKNQERKYRKRVSDSSSDSSDKEENNAAKITSDKAIVKKNCKEISNCSKQSDTVRESNISVDKTKSSDGLPNQSEKSYLPEKYPDSNNKKTKSLQPKDSSHSSKKKNLPDKHLIKESSDDSDNDKDSINESKNSNNDVIENKISANDAKSDVQRPSKLSEEERLEQFKRIYAKRTVGEVLRSAQARYFARKVSSVTPISIET